MNNKINELLKFAQEMEAIGIADGTVARRIEARIKAQELKKKFTNPKPMTGEERTLNVFVSKIIFLNLLSF
ncbi:TPA: hypothetical protein ACPFI9_000126 [Providencia rettgeri]